MVPVGHENTLQDSTATLIVIGQSKLQEALQDATRHAVKQFEKELSTDIKSFDKDLTEAVNQLLEQESTTERGAA